MSRKEKIARSITNAVVCSDELSDRRSFVLRLRRILRALFTLYSIQLQQYAGGDFAELRHTWQIKAATYLASFETRGSGNTTALETTGAMGYSGSTFFNTVDEKYLVKSVPRHFEHSFFRDDFLQPYVDYMTEHLESMLIRITDFLAVKDSYKYSPGLLLGTAPSHHIIMENLLVGKDEGEEEGRKIMRDRSSDGLPTPQYQNDNSSGEEPPWKWQTWDLKPTSYFFPERDIAEGRLTSEATKSRLADEFNDKLVLTQSDSDAFLNQLNQDTQLLEKANAVDYSLFLVRIPVLEVSDDSGQLETSENPFEAAEDRDQDDANSPQDTTAGPDLAKTAPTPSKPPFTPPVPPSWRTGIRSADGSYIYRAAILDFFWAKHKTHARMMTKLVKTWNRVDPGGSKGPMSITTNSKEYRERFVKMCKGFVEVRETDEG